jgi:hypothetical protein
MAILNNLEDWDRVFEDGRYFFYFASLYLYFWTKKFNPKKEYFTAAPIWI